MQSIQQSQRIRQLSNQELLSQTKTLVQKERDIHIQILHHLREIESRKLYFSQGFSSLFDYVVKELGYSEGAAYRRIKAMRLCRDMPDTEARLQSGRLSLSSACQLQSFFEKQAKKANSVKPSPGALNRNGDFQGGDVKSLEKSDSLDNIQSMKVSEEKLPENSQKEIGVTSAPKLRMEDKSVKPLSIEQKQDLLEKAESCSTREMARLLSEVEPSLSVSREQTRFLGNGRVEIKVVVDENCYRNIEELKNLFSHRNPDLSYGKLFGILVNEGLKRHTPYKKRVKEQSLEKDAKAVRVTSEPKLGKAGVVSVTSAPKLKKIGDISVSKAVPVLSAVSANKNPGAVGSQYRRFIRRTVPAKIRRDIWMRDRGRCTYVNPKTGKRCDSRYLLQVDHIKPFALGGGSEKENLRLLCAGHNRFRSEKTFFRK